MRIAAALPAVLLAAAMTTAIAAPVLGGAPFDGDVASAREAAIADALQNAALFNGVAVKAVGRSERGWGAESQQVRPAPLPTSYTLLHEWREGNLYFVQIEPGKALPVAATPPAAATGASPKTSSVAKAAAPVAARPVATASAAATATAAGTAAGAAAPMACGGASYRRKALVTPFWLREPAQANDLSSPSQGFQRMLADQLVGGGRFLAYSAADELAFTPQPNWIDPQLRPEQVRMLARRYGVQFVIGGVVHDLSTSGEKYRPTYGHEVRPDERKITAGLPLLDWMGVGVKSMPKYRQVDLEVYVFDGVSGALVNRHRSQQVASGQVMARPDQASDSASFNQSDLGRVVGDLLAQLSGQVAVDISCIPFSARVTRVEGRRLYFDAGTLSGIAPGDTLQLYRLRAGQNMQALNGYEAQAMGMVEDLAGNVRVEQVQPLFSLALFDGAQAEVGDYVRFVSTGKMP